jgi:hypothetical protein
MHTFEETTKTQDGVTVTKSFYSTHKEALNAMDVRMGLLIQLLSPVSFYIGDVIEFKFKTAQAEVTLKVY